MMPSRTIVIPRVFIFLCTVFPLVGGASRQEKDTFYGDAVGLLKLNDCE